MDDWLTAEYCERHYNLVPPEVVGQLLAELGQRSAPARARAAQLDMRYGSTPDETLDVFRPAGRSRAIVVFIHGGLWQFGDKDQFAFPATAWNGADVTYVAVNYSLVPAVTIEDQVAQCRRALVFIRRQAGEFGADAGKLYVAGHSSGGHLAALMMATDWTSVESGLPRQILAGGLTLSGVHDLEAIRRTAFMNAALQLDQRRVAALSPTRLDPVAGVRLFAAVGELENEEFQRQTRVLCEAWKVLPQQTLVVRGADHFTILDHFADPSSELFGAAAAMIA
jgi:arylformamidase